METFTKTVGYIYIAQYYDVEERNIGINDKKVGRTRDLSAREIALNNTKGPIGVFFRKAWNTGDDTVRVEKSLHTILENDNSDGEWFKDADETLVERVSNFMSEWGYEEKSLETDSNRKNLHLIVGETSSLNNKIYNSGGKAWQNPRKEYGNKNNRHIGWTASSVCEDLLKCWWSKITRKLK